MRGKLIKGNQKSLSGTVIVYSVLQDTQFPRSGKEPLFALYGTDNINKYTEMFGKDGEFVNDYLEETLEEAQLPVNHPKFYVENLNVHYTGELFIGIGDVLYAGEYFCPEQCYEFNNQSMQSYFEDYFKKVQKDKKIMPCSKKRKVRTKNPIISPRKLLQIKLTGAVEREDFEGAALLRDKLKRFR